MEEAVEDRGGDGGDGGVVEDLAPGGDAARARLHPAHPRPRRRDQVETRTPGWKARRWVVEACHSWLNRNRGILIRWSKKEENHLALLQLACGLIAFKKANTARHALAQTG